MPPLTPVSHRELVRRLKRLGFSGPESGGKHSYMQRGSLRVRIPNPHRSLIGVPLLADILEQAGVDISEWLSV